MAANNQSIFLSLPAEIHREIYDLLEDVPAVLLSLTCQRLRETYKLQFPSRRIELNAPFNLPCLCCQQIARYRLNQLLVDWIPSDIKYDQKKRLFVRKLWTERARLRLRKLLDRAVEDFKQRSR